ncbi:MAG: beta-lactamase family protein [Nitrospinae bacterium]|nr:beta-lactamase family protein [Nitrospinota bacterium]
MAAKERGATANTNRVVREAVDAAIREGGEIGLQVAAYVDGEPVVDVWGGLADETTGQKVNGDTLFPVFSVTKAVTATALHIQAERGLVDYDTPIAHYWPEFGAQGKDKGTVRDALTHRIGIPQMPAGVTPELMCDWDWMVQRLADMKPLFEPGTRSAYLAYTFGWIIGEVVRRTDAKRRPFGTFVQEEICTPLGIDSLWIGIPDAVEPRVAKLTNIPRPSPEAPGLPPEALIPIAIPLQVGVTQKVFGRSDVRRACIPGAGGIMNARSAARFFAMLANGGELGGVRLLSKERVRSFSVPRPNREEFDPVVWRVLNLGMGGFHLGGESPPAPPVVGRNPYTICHPGAGGSIGWADPDARLAVAICHNRMFDAPTPEGNPLVPIGNAVREALGVAG